MAIRYLQVVFKISCKGGSGRSVGGIGGRKSWNFKDFLEVEKLGKRTKSYLQVNFKTALQNPSYKISLVRRLQFYSVFCSVKILLGINASGLFDPYSNVNYLLTSAPG